MLNVYSSSRCTYISIIHHSVSVVQHIMILRGHVIMIMRSNWGYWYQVSPCVVVFGMTIMYVSIRFLCTYRSPGCFVLPMMLML